MYVRIAVIIVLALVVACKPSTTSVTSSTLVNAVGGTIQYKGDTYRAQWEPAESTHYGYTRYTGRMYNKWAPFITTEMILTTGDYTNPELVRIAPVRNSQTTYQYKLGRKLEGGLMMIHCLPASESILRELEAIGEEEWVRLTGRNAVGSRVDGPNNGFLVFGHANHKIFLVSKVERLAGPIQ